MLYNKQACEKPVFGAAKRFNTTFAVCTPVQFAPGEGLLFLLGIEIAGERCEDNIWIYELQNLGVNIS